MMLKFVQFKDIDSSVWDKTVSNYNLNLNYERYFINYEQLSFNLKNCSGVVFDGNEPIAIFVVYLDDKSRVNLSHSLCPVYFNSTAKEIHEINYSYLEHFDFNSSLEHFLEHPPKYISWVAEDFLEIDSELNYFEDFELVINLNESQDKLNSRLSRNHKRTIKKSMLDGQKILILNQNSPTNLVSNFFELYKEAHITASGRQTRPDSSFSFMLDLIKLGIATLFVTTINNQPLSFLYCDANREFSRGWSQVTCDGLNKGLFPRTLLEWTAMMHYKSQGKSMYHLGSIRKSSALTNSKISSINEFKLRFGPMISPNFKI